MRKSIARRAAYFVIKVSERRAVHPEMVQPRAYKYRYERLTLYRTLLMKEIAKAGYEIPR